METRKRSATFSALIPLVLALLVSGALAAQNEIKLPSPTFKGKISVEQAIIAKKSIRNYTATPLTSQQVSQILWAANGSLPADAVSSATAKVIPSAGGLYALEVFLVTGKGTVKGIPDGTYLYRPPTNSLVQMASGDNRTLLAAACLSQMWLARAPALLVICGVMPRTTAKYGPRGYQYVFMEAGASDQNVYLQAESLGLHAATVGAFNDAQVRAVLKLPKDFTPLLVLSVGK